MSTGSRWVFVQFVLLLAIGFSIALFGGEPRPAATIVAVVVFAAGQGMALAAAWQMRRFLTAHPAPTPGAILLQSGIYGLVRHPMYGGVLLIAAAVAIFDLNPVAAALTIVLAGVFVGKVAYEETLLAKAYVAYESYRAQVPKRFIPWLI